MFYRLLIMTKDFAAVTFPNDGDSEEEIVSEVPSVWLHSDLTQCWWPPVKNVNIFIVKQTLFVYRLGPKELSGRRALQRNCRGLSLRDTN